MNNHSHLHPSASVQGHTLAQMSREAPTTHSESKTRSRAVGMVASFPLLLLAACGGPQHSVTEYEEVWKEAEGSAGDGESSETSAATTPPVRKPCPDPASSEGAAHPNLGRVGDEEVEPEEAHRRAILEEYDTDGNKWLDKTELTTMYRLRAGQAFLEADVNRDGRLSAVEASGACGDMSRGALSDFSLADADGDGSISRFEFESAAGSWIRRHESYTRGARDDAAQQK